MAEFDFLRKKPFNLDEKQMEWVQEVFSGLTQEEKIGQLFCLCGVMGTEEEVEYMMNVCKPGGVMFRPMPLEQAIEYNAAWKKHSKIPMLVAANLEKGANGIISEGTMLGAPTQIAATDDIKTAERLSKVCAKEGKTVGANWAFAPIIDIDYNWRNPITNTRTFGSDPDRVREFGRTYVENVQALGVAASIKHFPGDGCDERDQHLVTSINDLSTDEWDATYGKAYQESIDAGALTVMVGHIMQPAYSKKLNPELKDEEIMPATLAPELINGLLRGKLGFNGLICTDATSMLGFTIPMSREKAVPYSIACGSDVFLFAKNLEEDYGFMCKGVEDGIITQERLDDAVIHVLGLKAALKLHEESETPTLEEAKKIVGCEEHLQWALECADESVTLVKEEVGVLPLTPSKYKKILLHPIENDEPSMFGNGEPKANDFKALLEKEGFEVELFEGSRGMEGMAARFGDTIEKYDAIIYMANLATKSNQTSVRITWGAPMAVNGPNFIQDVPTIFVSIENPYHLIDVPRIKTFINTYSPTQITLEAVVNKLVGKSEFKGVNPVDPFCGRWDTRL